MKNIAGAAALSIGIGLSAGAGGLYFAESLQAHLHESPGENVAQVEACAKNLGPVVLRAETDGVESCDPFMSQRPINALPSKSIDHGRTIYTFPPRENFLRHELPTAQRSDDSLRDTSYSIASIFGVLATGISFTILYPKGTPPAPPRTPHAAELPNNVVRLSRRLGVDDVTLRDAA